MIFFLYVIVLLRQHLQSKTELICTNYSKCSQIKQITNNLKKKKHCLIFSIILL